MHKGTLARQLGLFGTTMAVIAGIIGAGIFINTYLVAKRKHTPALILGAWIAGRTKLRWGAGGFPKWIRDRAGRRRSTTA